MQSELELVQQPITAEVVDRQPSMTAVIKLAVQVSGREPKGVASDMGIDSGHWSRIMSGNAHFPQDKYEQLFDLLDNEIPLEWLARKRGYGLVLLEDEKDRQIRELQAQLQQERAEREVITKFVKETGR